MTIAAALSILTTCYGFNTFAQVVVDNPAERITVGGLPLGNRVSTSPGWPFGLPHTPVALEGVLAWSDGDTLSMELPDQRIIRFQLDAKTRYFPEAGAGVADSFHMTDFVRVEAEVDNKGLRARSVRFLRKASVAERGEILQSPEVMQPGHANLLGDRDLDPAADDRRLTLVSKPQPIASYVPTGIADAARLSTPGMIAEIRRKVNESFENLPSLRARQVTSMFRSSSKPVKWIPDGVVTAEIAYEEDRESYTDLKINGKQSISAPVTVDSDFMRSMDKAWSTGDFKTISHCIFSELADSDFSAAGTGRSDGQTPLIYDFRGRRSSGCVGINFRSQISYPGFKGSMQVGQNGEILHVELEALDIPAAFPLDRAERSVDFAAVRIGGADYLLPQTAYWFGCFRNTYACFLNRVDFRDYRRFGADSTVKFGN
jgi:hypothetical protein